MKNCCFIGHRKIELAEELKQNVKDVIENLIVVYNVSRFLFGSRSEFDTLCYNIVTELKEKYTQIIRIAYTCRSESFVLESERERKEKIFSRIINQDIHLFGYEEEVEHKTKLTAGRASYIERNQAMINDSDYCIFYYDENYQAPENKYVKRYILSQPKSGTRIAYQYATKKKKTIYNLFKHK